LTDTDLKTRQAAWETPRNVAILAGTVAAVVGVLAGVTGFRAGYMIGQNPPPQIVLQPGTTIQITPPAPPKPAP
jgi:hypothetical protein